MTLKEIKLMYPVGTIIVVTGMYLGPIQGVAFVGKIFIVAFNGVDDICSLSDDDIEYLIEFISNGIIFIPN